jgi:arsenical pump membrane protein
VVTAFAAALLALGVVGALTRPRGLGAWVIPTVCAALAVALGALDPGEGLDVLRRLASPVAFLLVAVPLSALLDELHVFDVGVALASRTRHVDMGLWLLGALTVTALNLDAAVVLLTPLYVGVARRRGVDPLAFAAQPALLACLASSALPVSNLTNLIAQEDRDLSTGAFLSSLGLPTLAAVSVGYVLWRRTFPASLSRRRSAPEPVDQRALRTGVAVLVVLVTGFTLGPVVGIDLWIVVLGVDVVLIFMVRSAPWRAVPIGTAATALSLAVLATAVAVRIDLRALLEGGGAGGTISLAAAGAVAANLLNNLPAFLVLEAQLPPGSESGLWPLLLGVNMGPTLIVTGSLSGLLWLHTARRAGVDVGPSDYFMLGVKVGLPATIAAGAVLVITRGL